MLQFKWLAPGDVLKDAFAVREAVFIEEQRFSREGEFDGIDLVSHHLVLYDDLGQAVATGRLFPDGEQPGNYHVGRVAVLGSLRGTGAGRLLMEEMERKAAELGGDCIVLSAQCQARAFYEKCGYGAHGAVYMDEHCPHIRMEKVLRTPAGRGKKERI